MSDKRREPRHRVSWPVRIAGISGCGEGRLINASLCGILFSTSAMFEDKELAVLSIEIDPITSINCAAQIVRVEECDTRILYGADIRYISSSDRQKLSFALLVLRESAA